MGSRMVEGGLNRWTGQIENKTGPKYYNHKHALHAPIVALQKFRGDRNC